MFSFPAGGEYPRSILCGYRHQRPLAAGPDHWRGDPAIHGPPAQRNRKRNWGVGDLWNYFAHGEELELTYDVALFLNQVGEDTVTLTYRYPDGKTTDTVVLDSRTGALCPRQRRGRTGIPCGWGAVH